MQQTRKSCVCRA